MDFTDRLRAVRNHLGYSQKAMAEAVGTNQTTWRVYEMGKSVPGGNVLEALARLGFNVNWLLTGEGEMKPQPCGWFVDRFKQLRGNLSFLDFSKKIRLRDPEKWVPTLQAIEEGRIEPSFGLMIVLFTEMNVRPEWLLEGGGPMLKSDEKSAEKPRIDQTLISLLYEVIEEIDEERILSAQQKSELFSFVYTMNIGTKYTKERLKRFIEGVCSFIEQGIDFDKLSDQKLSNMIIEIAHHVVKGV